MRQRAYYYGNTYHAKPDAFGEYTAWHWLALLFGSLLTWGALIGVGVLAYRLVRRLGD
jgi:hypothetical protein